jgi:hypothetical protein
MHYRPLTIKAAKSSSEPLETLVKTGTHRNLILSGYGPFLCDGFGDILYAPSRMRIQGTQYLINCMLCVLYMRPAVNNEMYREGSEQRNSDNFIT